MRKYHSYDQEVFLPKINGVSNFAPPQTSAPPTVS